MKHVIITLATTLLFSINGYTQIKKSGEFYTFNFGIEMKMKEYKKNGKETSNNDFTFYSNTNDNTFFGVAFEEKGTSSMSTIDLEANKMTSYTNAGGMKMAISIGINPEKYQDKQAKKQESMPEFKSTGNTKTIMNYTCNEYMATSEDGVSSFWVSDKAKHGITSFFLTIVADRSKASTPKGLPKGNILEIEQTDKKNRKTVMTVIKFNENINKTYSTSEYKKLGL